MEEPTIVLRHYQDNCPSLNLSLARQVEGMEHVEPNKSYLDLRSASRARYHHLRKRQPLTLRWKHCHLDCSAYEHRHLSSRRRRMKKWEEECDEEAYWDERIVGLEHKESLEFMDPVQAYYNHGHNATTIESLRPTKYAEEEEAGGHDWVDVDDSPDDASGMEVTTSSSWTLSLHPPPQPNSSPFTIAGRCVWGESTFTWHRNASGYWELGYANQYMVDEMVDPYGCRQTPLPLSCHCCSPNFGIYACSCTEFDEHEPSPEDQQQCHLMEWLGEEAWDAMLHTDIAFALTQWLEVTEEHTPDKDVELEPKAARKGKEWAFIRPAQHSPSLASLEWDLVSTISSTGSWRILDVA